MQTRATHPKTARREAKSDKKKEERIGAQLMAEITEPIDDTATAAAVSEILHGNLQAHAPCKYTRGDVRGKWLELRQRLQASGVDAPLPLEPSLTIPKSFLATMMVSLPHLGKDVRKRGPPEYADFAKSVPQENPFTPASAHAGGTSQSNISQYNNGCSGSHYYSQPNSVSNITHNYNYSCASAPAATAPAAAPAATAPPSSEAQQLADVKDMFEQGLIPSREIYEDKVRQILGLR